MSRSDDDRGARRGRRRDGRLSPPAPTYPPGLPITARREELLATIDANQVVVVAGETGSGKSTQLPKLCLELGRGVERMIGHTQPRRVAARTIAERVAEELGSELGGTVGYAVRFTDVVGEDTAIKVMTDGILLAEIQRDRRLSRYDTLIVDEAHERSLNIDFLLGYLHRLLPERPDLKLIITSATIDTERFSAHFDGAPIVEVSGRTHPVEVRYRPFGDATPAGEDDDGARDDRDQAAAVCDAVDELCREGPGDVLVFLSGEREIRDTGELLAERVDEGVEVLPLHSRLPAAEQHRVFRPHRGRRIVLSTNVAETSVTVPGVRYVVDAGTARISRFSRRLKVQRLPIEPISRASADQRAGRCGRVAPGVCIRLYSEEDLDSRPEFTDPEILRTNLASVILQMLNLGLGDVEGFGFIDPPEPRAVRDGLALLEELGALASGHRDGHRRLTRIGRRLARLPIDPRLGRMVLEADRRGCVREVLIIAAALSLRDVRERPEDQRAEADALHRRFDVPGSDLLSLVRLWDHVEERRRASSWNRLRRECRAEHLSFMRIREWRDLHGQLARAARSVGVRPGTEEASPDDVHRAVLAGLLSQIGMRVGDERDLRGPRGSRFRIAPDSVLAKRPPAWVMAAEVVETNRVWARRAATISPEWIEELAGPLVRYSHGDVRWDARAGRAVCTERGTLHGLPVVPGRTVGLARIDPEAARELFIDHALVRREWETHHRFVTENEVVLEQVRDLGERLRRDDLFDHDDTLRRFYDDRVGPDVVSGRHFDRWWGEVRGERPDLLTLTIDDVLGDDPALDPRGLPDTWRQGDVELDVTYRYAPGEDLDGVTVHVPLFLLDRVGPWDFDWQVPGRRRELVEALVATLPRERRRDLGSLRATAREVAGEVVADGRIEPRPLVDAVAEALRRRPGGEEVTPSDLDERAVAPHLRITFAVTDGDRVIAHGKDLDAVRKLVGGRVRRAVADAVATAHPGLERTGLTGWPGGDVPRVVRATVDGHEVVGHPALLDDGETVSLRVLSRADAAEKAMVGGIRRLVLRAVPVGVRGLADAVDDEARRALIGHPTLGLGALLRDAIDAAATEVVLAHGAPTWTGSGFAGVLDGARRDLRSTATRTVERAGRVVVAAAEVEERLARLTAPSLARSVDDARAQLERLVRPGFVVTAGTGRLDDVARYVRAIASRLDRLPEAPDRDEARLGTARSLERSYAELLGALTAGQVTPRVTEAGWLLEELRVGLFAQHLGTRVPVSPARVTRELDALWAGDLD